MKKILKVLLLILIISLIIFILSFNDKIYKSDKSGVILNIPSFSKYEEECCQYGVTFKSLKTVKMLKKDLNSIFKKYEEVTCEDKVYYYNSEEDYTIVEYGIHDKLINSYYINYTKGKMCKDEYKTKYPIIENISMDYTKEEAIKDGYYVVVNEKKYNKSMYTNFMNDVSKNKNSFLRTITFTTEGDIIIIDIDYNEKFSITIDYTRDKYSKDRIYKKYEFSNIGVYKNNLYAYNGEKLTKEVVSSNESLVLFGVK